jgi:hypothetical protein
MTRFAIVIDNHCAGFVLPRRHQYEAFDSEEVSLGTFDTEDGAVTAITQNMSTDINSRSGDF